VNGWERGLVLAFGLVLVSFLVAAVAEMLGTAAGALP
jgi:hypothetical protein